MPLVQPIVAAFALVCAMTKFPFVNPEKAPY
jgi:hypothetical protein